VDAIAIRMQAIAQARELLAGRTAPIEAARGIWDLALMAPDGEILPELHPFVYAASEWADRPEDHQNFEAGIVESARDLLNSQE
jgi:hypothetical protein